MPPIKFGTAEKIAAVATSVAVVQTIRLHQRTQGLKIMIKGFTSALIETEFSKTRVEYLLHVLEEHGVELDEFDVIVLNNPQLPAEEE